MDKSTLQAWWFAKQGLANPDLKLTSAQVLERSGWARSVGDANPYLTLFSRAGIGRETVDRDVANLEIHELPSARGCTYVIPKNEFALALTVGQGFSAESEIALAKKHLGVTDQEIDRLIDKVLVALEGEPKDPRILKDLVGDAVRNLGDAGKKRGMTTTLPLALGRLQSSGQIRRVPMDGRLDRQRYAYTRWDPSPLAGFGMDKDEALLELGRRFFQWIGPATAGQFQWFSGLGVKAAKDIVAQLGVVPVQDDSDLLLFPEDRDALLSFKRPADPIYALVAGIDSLFLHRRNIVDHVEPQDLAKQAIGEKGFIKVGDLADLTNNAILDRGRLIGLWEFDPGQGTIAWTGFVPRNKDLEAAVAKMEAYSRDQLGDVRSFSLDSPESRAPKIAALREN